MKLTEKQIEKIFDQYLEQKLREDPEFVDNVTDSWIFDAEDWFWKEYNLPDWDDPRDKPKELIIFGRYGLKRFNETYKQRYGKRDAMESLSAFVFEINVMAERYRCDIKPYLDQQILADRIELKFNELIKEIEKINK